MNRSNKTFATYDCYYDIACRLLTVKVFPMKCEQLKPCWSCMSHFRTTLDSKSQAKTHHNSNRIQHVYVS